MFCGGFLSLGKCSLFGKMSFFFFSLAHAAKSGKFYTKKKKFLN